MTFEGTEWRDENDIPQQSSPSKFASKPFTVFHLSWRCHILLERVFASREKPHG